MDTTRAGHRRRTHVRPPVLKNHPRGGRTTTTPPHSTEHFGSEPRQLARQPFHFLQLHLGDRPQGVTFPACASSPCEGRSNLARRALPAVAHQAIDAILRERPYSKQGWGER